MAAVAPVRTPSLRRVALRHVVGRVQATWTCDGGSPAREPVL